MWVFLTAGPVVSIPLILAELPQRKNCGDRHEEVQLLDIHRRFFSGLHLAVGRHHRRRIPRYGLQLSRVEVFLNDQYAYSLRNLLQTIFPPVIWWMRPA